MILMSFFVPQHTNVRILQEDGSRTPRSWRLFSMHALNTAWQAKFPFMQVCTPMSPCSTD